MDFEIHLRSLRGHKGVKGQIYKDAPIELKFQYNDPYDILSILKYFFYSFEVIKGSQSGQRSNFQNFYKTYWLKSRFWVIWGHRGQKLIFTKNASPHTIYIVWSCDLCI